MNIVERVARMLDREGTYSEWYKASWPDAKPCEPTTRQKYFRAVYEQMAVEVLKLALKTDQAELRRDLVEFEKDGWRRLGVPIDDPVLKEVAAKTIAAKYA